MTHALLMELATQREEELTGRVRGHTRGAIRMMPAALTYALADDDQRTALNRAHAARTAARDQPAPDTGSRGRLGRRVARHAEET